MMRPLTDMRPFLVAAGEAPLRASVARLLRPLGYRVELASTGKLARQLIDNERFAGVVLAPARLSGYDPTFIEELRGVQKIVILADGTKDAKRLALRFPDALVTTAHPLNREKLLGFVGRPDPAGLNIKESMGAAELLHFAGCTLDISGRVFLDNAGQEVALTRNEFTLLAILARHPGRAISRAELRGSMAVGSNSGGSADDRSIDMLVARLRRKIERDPAKPHLIVTVPGIGYKFATPVQLDEVAPTPPAASQVSGKARRAERRQVTVVACHLIGLAALSAKLDLEDLDRAIRPVYAACAETVARFGGKVTHTLGDSLLAYFGYPRVHENDAERAVRAALELLRVVRGIEVAPAGTLRARIGIATGAMLLGEATDAGAREPAALGEPLNLARHLQHAAPADSVLIGARTHRLIGRFFHYRQLEPVKLEGQEPAPAWQVIEQAAEMPRFEALRREGMFDLIGRATELEQLLRCWSSAASGLGQVVQVMGEPGIGKSRLVVELEARCAPHAVIRWSGSPHRTDAPLSALIEEIRGTAGFAKADSIQQKVDKIRSIFGITRPEAGVLIASLLGVPCDASPEISQLGPGKRKERTFATLLARIEAMAARHPVFAVVEDVHWLDPSSLEFIARLVERTAALRILLVVVARPEFVAPWPDDAHVTTLSLSRLSRLDAAHLVSRVAGKRKLATTIETDIVRRAEGVPLFLEELTKSMLESGAARGRRLSASFAASIPATLQGLLLARLDRLDRGKEAAQAGAVIGKEFSFELLRAITGIDETMLVEALDQLVASGLALCRGAPPQATFVFKHALVRDAAYAMLTSSDRRKLHAKVAEALEMNISESAQLQPELLAYHFQEAGLPNRSIAYLVAAAEAALLRSTSLEALSNLAQARELIAGLPESRERLQLELKLEITLARALLARSGYTAPETRAAYRRAREDCEALGDQSLLPLTMHGQWVCNWIAANHSAALEEAQRLHAWGQKNDEPVGLAVGHSDIGLTLATLGELTQARHHLEQALQINKFALPGREPFVASHVDAHISTWCFLQHCLLLLGFPDQAERAGKQAAALKPDNLYSQALAQTRLIRMRVLSRDPEGTYFEALELLRVAEQQGYPYFVGNAQIYLGWALAQRGESADGLSACQAGLAQLRAAAVKCWMPLYIALLAECYEWAGDHAQAIAAVGEALAAVEATGERVWHAEIMRLKGRLLQAHDGAGAAKPCFVDALRIARQQGSKLLELRAACSLANLLQRSNKQAQAREVLRPVYGWFNEGLDHVDLRQAKAILDGCNPTKSATVHHLD
jgi:class 3 adenylate cyclase/DNA-binding response OmpR family regulator/predicted ATPase